MTTVDFELIRLAYLPDASLGRLELGSLTLYTVERAWKLNRPRVSCIPEGTYVVRPRRFNRGGYDALEVAGVPGRSLILFHKGNVASDVHGCIAVGTSFGTVGKEWGVRASAEAFAKLMEWHRSRGGGELSLRITQVSGARL